LLESDAGSLFFIGEILVDIPLPPDALTNPDQRPNTTARIAEAVHGASMFARPGRSLRRIAWMRAVAFRI
jgi:hypothetical protein